MRPNTIIKPAWVGVLGTFGLLGIYSSVLTAISGWGFVLEQFTTYWYFIVSLALGFGVQMGLYGYIKGTVRERTGSGKVLAVSGTTSTGAMISCCAHYLANILPVVGVTGMVSLVGQYQIELFWFGLASNAAGIAYMGRKAANLCAARESF